MGTFFEFIGHYRYPEDFLTTSSAMEHFFHVYEGDTIHIPANGFTFIPLICRWLVMQQEMQQYASKMQGRRRLTCIINKERTVHWRTGGVIKGKNIQANNQGSLISYKADE